MDAIDRRLIDQLQDGFPVCERPFLAVAEMLDIGEDELIARVDRLLADGTLTRFGPLFNAEKLGGALTLAAMQVPAADFDRVADLVNAMPAVAHNYARASVQHVVRARHGDTRRHRLGHRRYRARHAFAGP